ncbi:hypothetical protein M140_1540 [Bacteroides fragilis str. S38L3]|nr:hypothetical protein M140_1540 [Bacteroides fragilis str. S38L3]
MINFDATKIIPNSYSESVNNDSLNILFETPGFKFSIS